MSEMICLIDDLTIIFLTSVRVHLKQKKITFMCTINTFINSWGTISYTSLSINKICTVDLPLLTAKHTQEIYTIHVIVSKVSFYFCPFILDSSKQSSNIWNLLKRQWQHCLLLRGHSSYFQGSSSSRCCPSLDTAFICGLPLMVYCKSLTQFLHHHHPQHLPPSSSASLVFDFVINRLVSSEFSKDSATTK